MAAALAVLWLFAVLRDALPPDPPTAPGPTERAARRVTPRDDVRELGIASYPGDEPAERAHLHLWRVEPTERWRYQLGYALADTADRRTQRAFRAFADSVGYENLGASFRFRPSTDCRVALFCAWRFLARQNRADIAPLADRFRQYGGARGLDQLELARLVVGFVQSIPYETDDTWLFGIAPPNAVAYHRRGDCDSKALLGALLLRELGIGAVMLSSDAHRHAMLGIDVPIGKSRAKVDGRSYAMTEVTNPGWPIGRIPPDVSSPNDWRGIRISND